MDYKGNKRLTPLAKNLRRNLTKEEKRLWYDFLREHPANFRRQKVLGKYIADFYSAKVQLVIELDGGQHYTAEQLAADAERAQFLNDYGISVLRFSNDEIQCDFDAVCRYIDLFIQRIRFTHQIINETPLDRG